MLMVPIYAVASLIALFSLEAAFVIDAIRDIYEVRFLGSFPVPVIETCSGLCYLLLLCPLTLVSRRRTLLANPPSWPTAKGPTFPSQHLQA